MAVRQLVNLERLTTAHVNSIDGSMTYESGVEYKANTTVSYNGSLYTANVDIEDTDTDTPDIAPDKWSLTINASEVGTSGDISALAARVTALEDTVGDETDVLVKDVDDLQDDVKGLILVKINTIAVTAENDTVGSLMVKLYDALLADKNAESEDYYHHVSGLTLPGYATVRNLVGYLRPYSSGVAYNYFGSRLPNQNEMHIAFIEHRSQTTVFIIAKLSSAGTFTLGSVASDTVSDGTTFTAYIEYYKENT
jgi:hypothetical protein